MAGNNHQFPPLRVVGIKLERGPISSTEIKSTFFFLKNRTRNQVPEDSIYMGNQWTTQQDLLTQGVNANVQLKSSIPIGAKLEIAPPRLYNTRRSQGWNRKKKIQPAPKLLINAELYYGLLLLAPRLKKWCHPIWEANLQPSVGANVSSIYEVCLFVLFVTLRSPKLYNTSCCCTLCIVAKHLMSKGALSLVSHNVFTYDEEVNWI
jgi:hypothetical protein